EVFKASGKATPELKALYPKLVAWHAYLHQHRKGPTGLIDIFHPWESGTDNSPRWDTALEHVKVDKARLPPFVRRDIKPDAPNKAERPTDEQYDRFLWLVEQYKRAGYDDEKYLASGPDFRVGDVMFTGVMARADEALIELGKQLGMPADARLK